MDNEDNESVKDKQVDVKYRPGNLGLSSNKSCNESEQEAEKSPYEKLLEDETEKENKRRQAADYGFVLGTPTDESDGTILFNYDEPPKPTQEEEEFKSPSYNMDSDSTLNNALRRAIREQHDQEINKRFMEGGSSGSSLGSNGSNVDQPEQESESPNQTRSRYSIEATKQHSDITHIQSETLVSTFEPRPDETNALDQVTASKEATLAQNNQEPQLVQELVQSPRESITQEQEQAQPTQPTNTSTTGESLLAITNAPSPVKTKKPNFLKRLFNSKKQ